MASPFRFTHRPAGRDVPLRWSAWHLWIAGLLTLASAACSALPRKGVPEPSVNTASIPGMPEARFWGDCVTPELNQWLLTGLQRERVYLDSMGVTDWPDTTYLALSGGGAGGAFGAGLLCGWTAHGDRPAFRIVTGISTGAIIAPFVFAGPDYDSVLRDIYTSAAMPEVGKQRGIIDGLLSESLMDASGLRSIVERYVDQALLERIADEYRKGRGLILGTTNMDAQRPVIWAMGAIAASGHPDSLQLFRDVMMASAAIPGVFPPVMIRVDANGEIYDEMHTDGGVSTQVFLYPASLSLKQLSADTGIHRHRSVYVIRNAQLTPTYELTRRRTVAIAGRAVDTLIKTQGVGDLYRIYLGAVRDELDYNLAYIPAEFALKPERDFDRAYMEALFRFGYDEAARGYAWEKAPPGFGPPAVIAQPPPSLK